MVQSGIIPTLTLTASNSLVTRSTGNWTTDGFTSGMKVTFYNSSTNTATYTISSILSSTQFYVEESIVGESVSNAVVLSAETVLWNYNYITDRMEADDTSSPQHTVYLNLRGRDADQTGNHFETNRIGLKLESIQIDTSRTLPAYPIPGSGIVTGESRTVGIDLGMASKNINLTGIITDQRVIRNFEKVESGEEKNPSVVMTAYEIAQLIHTYVDSSSLQKYQNLNELVVLIPSRVDGQYDYHLGLSERTDDSSLTPIADLPLIPFSWRARNQENAGTIYSTIVDHTFKEFKPIHREKEPKGISGFIRSFGTQIVAGQPFVTFSMQFEAADIL